MSDTPRTDAAYFKPNTTLYDLAGEMKLVERELATETTRRERAERMLREFCQENPTRWTRLELMEVRDDLVEALKKVEFYGATGCLQDSLDEAKRIAREAIAAAELPTTPE